jgi:integrator complex subunit 6
MIIVFVVDTSPSMGKPLLSAAAMQKEKRKQNAISSGNNTHSTVMMGGGTGMSRLDLAKMAVESLAKGLDKRVQQHNVQEWSTPPQQQQQMYNIGLGGHCPPDQFLLLSTGRQKSPQHVDTAACGAGGRLLVGYGDSHDPHHPGYDPSKHNNSNNASSSSSSPDEQQVNIQRTHGSFERELKQLRATQWSPSSSSSSSAAAATAAPNNFPEDGGGAAGLNAALSSGLQLLSRYRLKNRSTENFGMGRLPSSAMVPSSSSLSSAGVSFSNTNASLQRACLVLITDGECLTTSPAEGGGSLQLQFGNMPLREFYQERES